MIKLHENQFISKITGYVSYVGSHWDPPGKEGLTRVLTSSYMYGTKSASDPLEIFHQLESTGAKVDTNVDLENMIISMSVPGEKLDEATLLLEQIFKEPKTSEEDLEKIKAKQRSKIRAARSDDFGITLRHFNSMVLKERWGIGTIESIDQITLRDLRNLQERVKEDSVKYSLNKVDTLETEGVLRPNKGFSNEYELYEGANHLFLNNELEQKVVIFGYPTLGAKEFTPFIRSVASNILNSGLSGLVAERIREQNSMAYYASFGTTIYSHKGTAQMSAGVSEKNVFPVVCEMKQIFIDIAEGKFSDERFENAKNYSVGQLSRVYDSIDSVAGNLVYKKLFGYPDMNFDQQLSTMKSIKRDDVIAYFGSWMDKSPYLVVNGVLPVSIHDSLVEEVKRS